MEEAFATNEGHDVTHGVITDKLILTIFVEENVVRLNVPGKEEKIVVYCAYCCQLLCGGITPQDIYKLLHRYWHDIRGGT
jgi:hypothetical protein